MCTPLETIRIGRQDWDNCGDSTRLPIVFKLGSFESLSGKIQKNSPPMVRELISIND